MIAAGPTDWNTALFIVCIGFAIAVVVDIIGTHFDGGQHFLDAIAKGAIVATPNAGDALTYTGSRCGPRVTDGIFAIFTGGFCAFTPHRPATSRIANTGLKLTIGSTAIGGYIDLTFFADTLTHADRPDVPLALGIANIVGKSAQRAACPLSRIPRAAFTLLVALAFNPRS